MDYAKLAYVKAEELEGRIAVTERKNNLSTSYTTRPGYRFFGDEYYLCALRSTGSVTLLVRGVISSEKEVSGNLSVLINGLAAATHKLTVPVGEDRDFFVMCAAYVNGEAELSVNYAGGVLQECRLLIYGDNASLSRGGGAANADKSGEQWMLVEAKDNYVTAHLFTEPSFEAATEILLGEGNSCDVAAGSSGFLAGYVTEDRVFVSLMIGGAVVAEKFVARGEQVALCAYHGGYLAAVKSGDGVTGYYVTAAGAVSNGSPLYEQSGLKRIGFIKGATPPMLIVELGDRSYIKPALPEHGDHDVVAVTLTFSTEV